MLSRNILIASVAFIILTSAVTAAPVEDKEPEENDFEAEEGEEELSEEEEDDDDSNGQPIKGAGAQRPTTVPKGPGHKVNEAAAQTSHGSSSGSTAASGTEGRDSQALPSSSQVVGVAGHWSSASKGPGAVDTASSDPVSHESSQVSLSHMSSGPASSSYVSSLMVSGQMSGSAFVSSEAQPEEAATADGSTHENGNGESQPVHIGFQIDVPGSESVMEKPETGNGHKQLINGHETGHSVMNNLMEDTTHIDSTGAFDSFGTNLEMTGILDHSSNDFLIGLMGGMGDSFNPDPYTDTTVHMGLAFQVEPTGAGLDPGLPSIISLAPPGNGRLRPVTDIHKEEQHSLVAHTNMGKTLDVNDPTVSAITDMPLDSVDTSHAAAVGMHMDVKVMGESIYSSRPPDTPGYESTGMTEGITNHTDATQTPSSMVQAEFMATGGPAGVSSQTDATGTAVTEPHRPLGDLSQPGATEQSQRAVPAGEQYHTSGQGPEGAENVELEDTC